MSPTRFLRRYGRVLRVTMSTLTLARYILELSLVDYSYNVELSESLLAASCLVLACEMKGVAGWEDTLRFYSGYSPEDLVDTVGRLHGMMKEGKVMGNVKTVTAKYSHVVFHEVAKIPLPDTVTVVRDQKLL